MQAKQPSFTAFGAAAQRAAHQILEGGKVFADPFARAILGEEADIFPKQAAENPLMDPIRLFVAARSRFAEDALAAAVSRGVRQAVILGAGFDTFALRNPHAEIGLRVFEVDHPATQLWKQDRLAQSGLALPASLTFVPIDFEQDDLSSVLLVNGFQSDQPASFLWLGVAPYLTREAALGVLRFIGSLPRSEVIFDYTESLESYPPEHRAGVAALGESVAALGEPWCSHFDPAELANDLGSFGFADLEDLDAAAIADRYFDSPNPMFTGPGAHVIRATRLD